MAYSSTIPTEKIIQRLQFENPWWQTAAIEEDIQKLPRRLYINQFLPIVKNRELKRAVVLMGPRRVGKTVLMHHVINTLLSEDIPSKNILFVGIDNPIYTTIGLEELFQLGRKASGAKTNPLFVFFDEIQYLKDWERHLKIMVDSYPQVKFIVSGSAAAALKIKSTESGAGRFTEFMLPPLTFQEFLALQYKEDLISLENGTFSVTDIKELNSQFLNYINFGGYPEVIFSETIRENMSKYIKGDIIDKVLLRDLPSLYGIRDVQEMNRFFAYLAYNTGKEFSLERISQESGIEKNTIKKYLEYLEAAFLIKVVNKIDEKSSRFKRITFFKIYLTNTSIRSAMFSPIDYSDDEMGLMVETAIYAQWLHEKNDSLRYARWKIGQTEGEVDMVAIDALKQKAIWCLEIKWSNRFTTRPVDLKSLFYFCELNNLNTATVTTIDKDMSLTYNNVQLRFIPAAVYAYKIGYYSLQ
jgi:predicted AAA+ superfamily ATPase